MAKVTFVPVKEFVWTDDFSYLRTLTCKNHPTARYYTKNPWARSIRIITYPDGMNCECPCPFADLMVIAEESQPATAQLPSWQPPTTS